LQKPALDAPEDIVLYELHVRDFSINDRTVPEARRGTFLAFTEAESNGMKHLKGLAEKGLTHVHLLPVFDIATITWVLVFASRFVVQRQLYDADETGWLATARIAMGWPLTAVAALATYLAIRSAQRALHAVGSAPAEPEDVGSDAGDAVRET